MAVGIAEAAHATGIRCGTAAPNIVDGQRVWGVMATGSVQPEPLPTDIHTRLAGFTELVGRRFPQRKPGKTCAGWPTNRRRRAGLRRLLLTERRQRRCLQQ